MKWIWSISPTKVFECGCCEMLVFRVCGVRHNLYVFSLYRNRDLDDQIFDCLLTSMVTVQAEDVRVSFLYVGDSTNALSETLDLLMTDVPELVGLLL